MAKFKSKDYKPTVMKNKNLSKDNRKYEKVFIFLSFWKRNFFLVSTFPDHCQLLPFHRTRHSDASTITETCPCNKQKIF